MGTRPCLASGKLSFVTLSLLLVVGCDLPGKPNPDDRPVPADRVLDFAMLYEQNCSGCHGADGKLGPAPPLNDPLFLTIVPDAELLRIIREGRRGTSMPAFVKEKGGPLTDAQAKVLAEGIKPRWGKPLAENQSVPPYQAQGPGSIERGKKVFGRACAMCHGEKGDKSSMRINDPAFLALVSDQFLRRIVITGRQDLGMPSYAMRMNQPHFKALTSAEIDDVVALLASWAPERPEGGRGKESRPAGPAKVPESRGGK